MDALHSFARYVLVLLVRISDQLDFLIYNFSVIYYAILKFQLIYFLEKIKLTCEAHNSLKELKLWGGKSSLVSMHAQAFAFFFLDGGSTFDRLIIVPSHLHNECVRIHGPGHV